MAKNRNVGSSTFSSNSSLYVGKGECENMLEYFKSDMRQFLAMQMDTLRIQRKQEEAERALAIFFPRCTRKHPNNECPLHSIEVCFVCENDHPTDQCPSLPRIKAAYQRTKGATESLYFMNQRRPHGPGPYQQGMQGTSQTYYNPNQVTFIHSYFLGVPLLILPSPHPLLGHIHLNTILNLLLIHFILMFSHNLSGMHLIRGGGPNTTLFPLFCLHHLLNHNHYLLLLQDNPRYLLNRTQTPITDRPNRYILERQHALPMLWRFRRSTYDLGRSF